MEINDRRYVSVQHTLLGGSNFYGEDVPKTITIKTTTTGDELEKCAAEAFHNVMVEKILPRCIEPKFNFRKLLEIDYNIILRKMLAVSCGPFVKPTNLTCSDCGAFIKNPEELASLETVETTPIPEDIGDEIVCPAGELLYNEDEIHLRFTRVSNILSDSALLQKLRQANANITREQLQYELSMNRLAYLLKSAGPPEEQKPFADFNFAIGYLKRMDANDIRMLAKFYSDATTYGDSPLVKTKCPVCQGHNAEFQNVITAYSFRPTVEQLRAWRDLRRAESQAVPGDVK